MPTSLAQREHMALGQLLTNRILDLHILQAMVGIPREPFLPEGVRGAAYIDEDLEVAAGRFLMAPLTFARLLELAEITPSSRVLVVGALEGYCAAVAAKLAGHVVATETDAVLVAAANDHLKRLTIRNAEIKQVSSLAEGFAPSSPYDAIIICGAVDFIPEALEAQLAVGGRLAAVKNIECRPDMPAGLGRVLLVRRIGNTLQYREHFDAAAALLPGFERPQSFTF
ncbi:MAG: protein-L-isoaspartate O-methyltransferase [Pseudomonadota bacterium]|nr:protein-L-isoaspartate O-methyltransferase [Pseudomonadota bacterium]MDE3038528.1 protein-L-isoaspartate O-methyltransferase [Pseudomonadota bacterium]